MAGQGGAKAAVRDVFCNLAPGSYVMKSDIKSYYASIDHDILFGLLEQAVPDRFILRLLWQYMKRTICYGGLYREVKRGISFRCPLSPLMGALYLMPLDECIRKTGCFYARYMDDWVIIAPTRWKLRKAIRIVNEMLESLRVEKHPDKTIMGKIEKGFDFLGYHFSLEGLGVAKKTIDKFLLRAVRLYEQEQGSLPAPLCLGCMLDVGLVG